MDLKKVEAAQEWEVPQVTEYSKHFVGLHHTTRSILARMQHPSPICSKNAKLRGTRFETEKAIEAFYVLKLKTL